MFVFKQILYVVWSIAVEQLLSCKCSPTVLAPWSRHRKKSYSCSRRSPRRRLPSRSRSQRFRKFENFANFWRARSRLYQNEFLQENMRLTAFFKLYKICILLHRCNLKILAKNQFEKSAFFVKIRLNFCKCWKICKILSNLTKFDTAAVTTDQASPRRKRVTAVSAAWRARLSPSCSEGRVPRGNNASVGSN